MRETVIEVIAGVLAAGAIVAAAVFPLVEETRTVGRSLPAGGRVVTLTAVAATGTWTDEDVQAGNYWYRSFPPARPILSLGQPTLLRLKSSDVIHSFTCPGLGVGPTEVYPGRVSEVLLTPSKEGVFRYYCTTICGEPHFGMQGEAVVVRAGAPVPPPAISAPGTYWLEPSPPPGPLRSTRGQWLFRRHGCFTCHGAEGKGGVPNWNYVKDTVPALNTLAERMFIPDKEGAEAVLGVLERRDTLDRLSADPPFARFKAFLAQYQSVKDLIRKGNPPGKKDPAGLQPPLEMPSFGARLSDIDIEDVMAYLMKLQHWEGEDK